MQKAKAENIINTVQSNQGILGVGIFLHCLIRTLSASTQSTVSNYSLGSLMHIMIWAFIVGICDKYTGLMTDTLYDKVLINFFNLVLILGGPSWLRLPIPKSLGMFYK